MGDPDIARAEIEATRARMSETIDEIEEALLRRKEEIQDRLDLLAPLREQPMRTLGIVFGVGLLLGLLTGDDEEDDEDGEDDGLEAHWELDAWERADRTRRLLRIAQAQEAELELLRSRLGSLQAGNGHRIPMDAERRGVFGRVRDGVSDRLSGLVADAVYRMMRGG